MNHSISLTWGICCLPWFSFYYLGFLLGNGLLRLNYKPSLIIFILLGSIPLQMLEGYGWLLLGDSDCGSQLKISSLITTILVLILSYYYLKEEDIKPNSTLLLLLGDYSFGIYLSHIMVRNLLRQIPLFNSIPFPISSIIVLSFSFLVVWVGQRICGNRVCRCIGFV